MTNKKNKVVPSATLADLHARLMKMDIIEHKSAKKSKKRKNRIG